MAISLANPVTATVTPYRKISNDSVVRPCISVNPPLTPDQRVLWRAHMRWSAGCEQMQRSTPEPWSRYICRKYETMPASLNLSKDCQNWFPLYISEIPRRGRIEKLFTTNHHLPPTLPCLHRLQVAQTTLPEQIINFLPRKFRFSVRMSLESLCIPSRLLIRVKISDQSQLTQRNSRWLINVNVPKFANSGNGRPMLQAWTHCKNW